MGISLPLTGLTPRTPSSSTPVFSLFSSVRSRSDLRGRRLLIGDDRICILQPAALQPAPHQGVLRGEDHVSGTKQGVGPGGKDLDVLAGGGLEDHLGAGGAADPVALLGLDPVDKVHSRPDRR